MSIERPTVACVVGTRPEAVKLAPVIQCLRRTSTGLGCRVIGTGQHKALLDQALADFELVADRDLGLMKPGQSLSELTARSLVALSQAFAEEKPDLVLAVGDTTTVLATGLACHYARIPFGHVEAGLRTGEAYRPFPEEKNREIAARLATIHFAPTVSARDNLRCEGIEPRAIRVTGNTVIDALRWVVSRSPGLTIDPPGERYVLVTAHRRENWGEPMKQIGRALAELLERNPFLGLVVPLHPNPMVRDPLTSALGRHSRARLIEPLSYPQFVAAMAGSAVVLTDSGGVQEEAPALGKPVIVLRPETERPEAGGVLVGTDPRAIVDAVERALRRESTVVPGDSPFGDGRAAERIVVELQRMLGIDAVSGENDLPAWPRAD